MLICVTSYPRSGQVWLTRLLAQAIDCPVHTYLPQDKGRDVALEGQHRESEHRVTRAHWLTDEYQPPPDRIVHLVRDPRDLCVSICHYWNCEDYRKAPRYLLERADWNTFVDTVGSNACCEVRYEDLLVEPLLMVARIIVSCGLEADESRIRQAIADQAFHRKRSAIIHDNSEFGWTKDRNLKHMRSGYAGQWKEVLESRTSALIEGKLGDKMKRYNYL